MYKIAMSALLLSALFACGGQSEEGWATDEDLITPPAYAAGEKVYMSSCVACHQENGKGVVGAFPPLADSDYLLADKKRAVQIAANGLSGPITVNGENYDQTMANQGLTNQQVTDVVNYILNAWGNAGGEVTLQEVEQILGK